MDSVMNSVLPLQAHTGAAPAIDDLLARQDLWRARDGRPQHDSTLATGHAELDSVLQHGGWPRQGMTELLTEGPCPQALRLLMPALGKCDDGLIVLVNPPARPNAALLQRHGIASGRLLVLRSDNPRTLLQATLEAASSETVSAMVVWLPQGKDDATSLRRLHLAAQQGRCWLSLVRDARHAGQASPAPLRLTVKAQPGGDLALNILKQPGGWGGQAVTVAVLPKSVRELYPMTAAMPAPNHQQAQEGRYPVPDLNSRFVRKPLRRPHQGQPQHQPATTVPPAPSGDSLPLPF